jgi:hypothetical protein
MACVFLAPIILLTTDAPSAPPGVGILSGAVAVAGFLLLLRWALWVQVKRSDLVVGLMDECTVEISPEGVWYSSAKIKGRLEWTAFVRIASSPDAILLYQGGRQALVVPFRAFPTRTAAERFLQAAKEWHEAETSIPQK